MYNIEANLGAIIKAARSKKGLTQENLGEKVGVGQRHIMGIENEGASPSYEVLYGIIKALDIPADIIFYPEKDGSDSRLEYLNRMLRKCGDRDIRAVTALVEAFLADTDE